MEMKFFRWYQDGVIIPWWRGLCWYDPCTYGKVTAPIGFNLVVVCVRWLWVWTRFRAVEKINSCLPPAEPWRWRNHSDRP